MKVRKHLYSKTTQSQDFVIPLIIVLFVRCDIKNNKMFVSRFVSYSTAIQVCVSLKLSYFTIKHKQTKKKRNTRRSGKRDISWAVIADLVCGVTSQELHLILVWCSADASVVFHGVSSSAAGDKTSVLHWHRFNN